jgi:chemotaxis protein CheD
MDRVIVGMADCRVENNPEALLITYALGSCIGVILYDPVAAVGGLLHFMLPESRLAPDRSRERPFMFADTGIAKFVDAMYAEGARRGRLIACVAGAAQILDGEGIFEIGKRNYLATRRLLWKHGIMLDHESIGGTDFRTVSLEVATGRVLLQESSRQREFLLASRRKGGLIWPTAF